jgi:integrase
MGLGGWPAVGLAELRDNVDTLGRMLRDGRDPLAEKQAHRQAATTAQAKAISFAKVAEQYIAAHEAGWRNSTHRQQWRRTLQTYAEPVIGPLPIHAITTEHVLAVLEPIWRIKPETASRLRGRIEAVLSYAKARGWRSGENPAAWRGHLALMLPARAKVRAVRHHAALDWREMQAFMAQLRGQDGIGVAALQFAILTAARSGEVRLARWHEIDGAVWTIPPSRMKAGKQHRVPLSESALVILHAMAPMRHGPGSLVFPGMKRDTPLSDMSLTAVLRRLGRGDLTVHGFRSTFRDWAAEATAFPNHVVEQALAHTIGSAVEAAYRRGDLFDKRRALMGSWATYCTGEAEQG